MTQLGRRRSCRLQAPERSRPERSRIVCATVVAVLVFLLTACQGSVSHPAGSQSGTGASQGGTGASQGGTGASPGGGTSGSTVAALCAKSPDPGPTPLVKLSTLQYRNTLRDLLAASGLGSLNVQTAPLAAAVPDDSPLTFQGLDARISSEHMKAYFSIATAVGNAIETSPALLTAVAGSCAAATALPAACVDTFLATFGRRAFRRPLSTSELSGLKQLNDGVRTPAAALRAMVVTILMSPRFVNHLEIEGTLIGGRQDLLALSPYEIASRLSYTFWQTLPDDQLLAAAADGSLATEAGFARELDRVFLDPRTQTTVWQFWNQWFHLDSFTGFATDRPGFQTFAAGENIKAAGHDVYADMVQELADLTALYTWQRKGTLRDLLTTDLSVTRSADLAHLYGVAPWTGVGDYPRIVDGSRAGLLQRGALLASTLETTNPFHRGALIRRDVLCDVLARPDPNSLPPGSLDPPPINATQTTRQRYAAKIAGNATCARCHGQFADLGYILEAYDSLGRYRTSEKVLDEQTGRLLATLPLDTTGTPRVLASDARPVSGPTELNQRIVDSGRVEACVAGNYFSYALRRAPVADSGDICAVDQLRAAMTMPGVGLGDVFKQLAQQAAFRRRRIATP